MCFRIRILCFILVFSVWACSPYRKLDRIRSGDVRLGLSVSEDEPLEDHDREIDVDSIRGTLSEGPVIMNAIRDSETGEMVATDVIKASRVVARFRNVAERGGKVSVGFDVIVPEGMKDSRYQLKIRPYLEMAGDTAALEPVYITGEKYRSMQLRGYERYRAFLASIVTDTSDFVRVRQLELFLARNFPQVYAMKEDSTVVDDSVAESLFGVTRAQAVEHYTRMWRMKANERRKGMVGRMYSRYVRDPIATQGIRLDTVIASSGDFIYRYVHVFSPPPEVRKVTVLLRGTLFHDGTAVAELPFPESIAFYISSLSTLVDDREKYRIVVRERRVYDNTKVLLDFRQGSAVLDTAMGDNASELRRVRRCVNDVLMKDEYELDSLKITASCSLEGRYDLNRRLSASRAETVRRILEEDVPESWKSKMKTSALPENWDLFMLLVENDTLLSDTVKKRIRICSKQADRHPDIAEGILAGLPEYRYLREKIYPGLRSVRFDFYMHRAGMVKDTVHTTEIDTVYMSGLEALRNREYKRAVSLLRSYGDYNSALALTSADYNHTALQVLQGLSVDDPKVCYLMALVLSRLEQKNEAARYLALAVACDPTLKYRANLDPELSGYINNN